MSLNPQRLREAASGCPLEDWLIAALRHPITKQTLEERDGRTIDGILDLRPALHAVQKWSTGQKFYEAWEKVQIRTGTVEMFQRELSSVRAIYATMAITGACLEVGGLDGRIRHFMRPGQRYACVDPYPFAISDIRQQPALTTVYPELKSPVNFVCGMAEHLPLDSAVFDTVHMRSVIDHFYDPAVALREAARVLKPGCQLIVGVSVEGGQLGIPSIKERVRETLRSILVWLGIERYRDHHMWHPTWPNLKQMIEAAGFLCDAPYWQNARVVYVRAVKSEQA